MQSSKPQLSLYTYLLILLFLFGLEGILFAQTFDKKGLEDFANSLQLKRKISIIDSLKKLPIIYQSANLGAAQAVHNNQLWSGGIAGLILSGSGQKLGYWDENQPLLTHQEYAGRVTFEDSEVGTNNAHATQMVGTMIATGVESNARGMANLATVNAWNWNNDIAEMALEAADGLLISAHPYIETAGWTTNSSICGTGWTWFSIESENTTKAYQFGYYDSQAQKWDSVAYMAPNYVIIIAAGNQRGEGPTSQPIKHWKYDAGFNCVQDSTSVREIDGGSTGYESINAAAVGKNVITVGAVESSSGNFNDLSSIAPISASGFGPTDDGRIKPDIVAPTNVYTSESTSTSSYGTGGGTSAATAIVAGSIALIREHYQNLHADTLSSASLRALLAQTADDVGNEGPDYQTGWGLLNTERAVRFLSSQHADPSATFLKDTLLTEGNSITLDFEHTSNRPLKITIAWTDPAGTPPISGNDPLDTLLVNDIDLSVSGNSVAYQPWKLDRNNPSNAATKGDNEIDTIEQVYITDAESGTYSVSISHKGTLQSGSQRVSILIGEAEPEITFETIASGNWKDATTWSGGVAPSSSFHRANIKHMVTMDTSATIRGVSFDGVSSELDLNSKTLSLYGGVFYSSGGLGFSGDTASSLFIFDWDDGSDSLKFKANFGKLNTLTINAEGDSITLGSPLSVYSKLSLQNGVFDIHSAKLRLISDSVHTAWLQKGSGSLAGNFTYSRMYTEESSGWRIISSPVENEFFSTLSDSFHTQGGIWADYSVPKNESSLWLFNKTTQDFSGLVGNDSTFTSGEGYLLYMFDDAPGGTSFPTSLEFVGIEPDSITLDLYRGTHDSLSYNLVGNPFAGTLDWHEIVQDASNLGTSYAVWDPSGNSGGGIGGFKYYNSVGSIGDAGRYLAPMQGFFVHSTLENAMLVFEQDQKVAGSPNKYGKAVSNPTSFIQLTLYDENGTLLDNQAHLSFSERSHSGTDNSDVLRINSLSGLTNHLSFIGLKDERRVFEGRSSTEAFDSIDFLIETIQGGEFTINWESQRKIPTDWKIELVDLKSNSRIDMSSESEYSFIKDDSDSRFRILINRALLSDIESDNPIEYALSQNYPNPFNPSTTISYSLKSAGNVRIEIYNTLGQKVSSLVNEQQSAGKHIVEFNASQLSSGVYFYRIESGDFTRIRSMVLIK